MNWKRFLFLGASVTFMLLSSSIADIVKIDTNKTGEPISKYIYGQFAEHLGKSINGGMWAEMIQDRKFYFPVLDDFDPWGIATDPMWSAGPYRFLKASPWKVIGPAGTVTMDDQHPFVGSQTPVVHVKGDGNPAGISQDGLSVIKDQKYTGRIILSGDDTAARSRCVLWRTTARWPPRKSAN